MSVLLNPPSEQFPNRIRWTVEECYRLAADSHLNGRYELIDGEILSKMGMNPPHRSVLTLIAEWLIFLFGKRHVLEQVPVRIPGDEGRYTEPEPDIVVIQLPTTAYVREHPSPADVIVLIEVADSSLPFDLTTKAMLYARNGMAEYWVADVDGRQMHIHRNPSADGYRSILRADMKSFISLESRPSDQVSVATFFPDTIYDLA